jgi:hypothetical protein
LIRLDTLGVTWLMIETSIVSRRRAIVDALTATAPAGRADAARMDAS